MVDDNVCNGLQVVLVDHGDAIPELRLRAVLAVQVVQVPGEIALVADGIAGGRHPHAREARLCNGLRLALQHLRQHSLHLQNIQPPLDLPLLRPVPGFAATAAVQLDISLMRLNLTSCMACTGFATPAAAAAGCKKKRRGNDMSSVHQIPALYGRNRS